METECEIAYQSMIGFECVIECQIYCHNGGGTECWIDYQSKIGFECEIYSLNN